MTKLPKLRRQHSGRLESSADFNRMAVPYMRLAAVPVHVAAAPDSALPDGGLGSAPGGRSILTGCHFLFPASPHVPELVM
jgi:hypothetical protein